MSASFGTPEEAHPIAHKILEHLQSEFGNQNPALVTAATAMALGALAASMSALGVTKPGRTRHVIDHLANMAKVVAETGLEGL